MFKSFVLVAAAAAALTAPALAAEPSPATFTRSGVTYVATDTVIAGQRVIEGREVRSGKTFRLVVSGGRVTGTYGGTPIDFREPARSQQIAVR